MAFERLLVAVDLSPISKEVLRQGVALADELDADLEVVHVIPRLKPTIPFSAENRRIVGRLQRESREEAHARLERLVGARRRRGVRIRVLAGEPHRAIVDHARRRRASLIVLGARGHSRIEEVLMGSTAQRAVRLSPVPVLLVPPPAAS